MEEHPRSPTDQTFSADQLGHLKPPLLGNISLFSALRWHLKNQCDAAAVAYTESCPEEEVNLRAEMETGVFRILEEAITHELPSGTLSALTLDIQKIDDVLNCRLEGEHLRSRNSSASAGSFARVASMQFRAAAMGGILTMHQVSEGHHFDLRIPVTYSDSHPPAVRL